MQATSDRAPRRTPKIDDVWQRIQAHAGQQFRQIRGQAFTYEAHEGYLVPSTTEQNLAKSQFAAALELVPLKNSASIQHLRGPSYLFAILMDQRIRQGDW